MTDQKTWKLLDLIKVSAEYLAGRNVQSPRLDAEVLLCDIMGLQRRVDLYAGFERELSGGELSSYRELIRRRAAREPVSRILGRRDFMGLTFQVTPDVLSPRPETELLVELAVEAVNPRKNELPPSPEEAETEDKGSPAGETMPEELERLLDSYAENVEDDADIDEPGATHATPRPAASHAAKGSPRPGRKDKASLPGDSREVRALDLGTGTGCIAVALAAHVPSAWVVAVDVSPKALAVARKNATHAGVAERVEFRQGDWFAGCKNGERFDLILSNPPYLVEGDPEIWPEVSRYDPPAALYGGKDGLDCYRRIIPDAPEWLAPGGRIFLEVGAGQARKVVELLSRRGFRDVDILSDYGGIERVVKGTV